MMQERQISSLEAFDTLELTIGVCEKEMSDAIKFPLMNM